MHSRETSPLLHGADARTNDSVKSRKHGLSKGIVSLFSLIVISGLALMMIDGRGLNKTYLSSLLSNLDSSLDVIGSESIELEVFNEKVDTYLTCKKKK